jgi:hypothetical protein
MEYVICPSMHLTQKHASQIELQQEYRLPHGSMTYHMALARMCRYLLFRDVFYFFEFLSNTRLCVPKLQDVVANQYKRPETAKARKSVSRVGKVGLSLLRKGRHAYSLASEENTKAQAKDHTRTLLLIHRRKRHVEQATLSPKSLRQALLIGYKTSERDTQT